MILKTVHDLLKEYKRRVAFGTVYHACSGVMRAIDRYRHYKIQRGNQIYVVPGTDYDTLPYKYGKAECPNCHEAFPEIEFEEIEYYDDKDEKNDK